MNKFILLLLFPVLSFSQTLSEDLEFYDNGKTRVKVYKNMDLEMVKRNIYAASGKLISSYNYDPKTGLKDGEFIDGPNKGFFKQGEINCNDCTIALKYGVTFKGNFKNGRPVGTIEVSEYNEKVSYSEDPTTSYLLSVEYNRPIVYYESYGTGIYELQRRVKLNYNENGFLEGKQNINDLTTLTFQNGVMTEIIVLNKENKSIAKDSINRDQKIWKIDNQYYKNDGFISPFNWTEANPFEIENIRANKVQLKEYVTDCESWSCGSIYDWAYFGSPVSVAGIKMPPVGIDYFSPGPLDESGLYISYDNGYGQTNDSFKRELDYLILSLATNYAKGEARSGSLSPSEIRDKGLNPLNGDYDVEGFLYSWEDFKSIIIGAINSNRFLISDISFNTAEIYGNLPEEALKRAGLSKNYYMSYSITNPEFPNFRFNYKPISNSKEFKEIVNNPAIYDEDTLSKIKLIYPQLFQ